MRGQIKTDEKSKLLSRRGFIGLGAAAGLGRFWGRVRFLPPVFGLATDLVQRETQRHEGTKKIFSFVSLCLRVFCVETITWTPGVPADRARHSRTETRPTLSIKLAARKFV